MPTINDRIGSQNVIRVLSNASAPPSRVNNLLDINAGRKDDADATGLLLIWDTTSAQYILGNDIAHGLNITGLTTFTRLEATGVSLSGVTTAATLSATAAISMGATSIINIDRQLQNIASLDSTTTATIEAAIVNAPNTFNDLQVTGISTFIGPSGHVGIATFDTATFAGITTFNDALNANAQTTLASALITDLTSGRVVTAGAGGAIEDSANLTFDGTKLTITGQADVVGHTELDTLNVSGVSTFVGVSTFSGDVYVGGDLYLKDDLVLDNITGSSLKISGLSTFTGDAQFDGNVSIAGTLTYEDVTNVDSVGIVTARSGIEFGAAGVGGTVTALGHAEFVGIVTASGLDAAIAFWTLGASGTDHYTFTGPGDLSGDTDPDLQLIRGQKYIFKNRSGGHPFRIQSTVNGSTGTQYSTGVTNNDGGDGTDIIFDVPFDAPNILYYQCTSHANMGGVMLIGERAIPANTQTGAYVLVADDAGKTIYISTGGVTINNSLFSEGDAVTIINNSGSNQTITQGSGVTLYDTGDDGSTGNKTLKGRGMCTVWFASASVGYISGNFD